MDNNKINQILEELYQIDPGLRKEDALTRKILMELYSVRPEIIADPQFVMALREKVIEKAKNMPKTQISIQSLLTNRFVYAGLVIAALAIITPILFFSDRGDLKTNNLSNNAFGPLAYEPVTGGRGGGGGGFGGGGGSAGMALSREMSGSAVQDKMSPLIYPAPDYTQTRYVYTGGEFDIPEKGLVYKRNVSSISGQSIINPLKNFPLSNLKNTKASDISLWEDREFGYIVSLNVRDGWISFFQNWEKWPMQDTVCSTEDCFSRDYLNQSQFPADEQIISIAETFLKEYGINKTGYGPGEVVKPWKYQYLPITREGQAVYPPELGIVYPLLIEGKNIYDEWGNKMGMNITVNIKYNRVTSASNILINSYDRSEYALTSDKEKILEIAAAGGIVSDVIIMNWQGKTVEIKIGTPELVYMQFYRYENSRPETIFVPALRFQIIDMPADMSFYKENVIVPLVPDIVNNFPRKMPSEPIPLPVTEPRLETKAI